jgi:L-lactate dehydrogenase (cytochrome)
MRQRLGNTMPVYACIDDLRKSAKRKVPRAFFDYVEAGSYSEGTLKRNRSDLEKIALRQRVLVDVSSRNLSTTVLGETLPLPLALSPVALSGLQRGDGEILACRAAQAAGLPYTLSTMSICSIEDVAGAVKKPFWFQLYVMRDRGFVADLIARAEAAGCSALVLTVDLQVLGQRHCDERNGLNVPPSLKPHNLIDMAWRLPWVFSVLRGKRWTFGNLAGHVKGMEDVRALSEWSATQFDQALSWKDVEWIRSLWPRKLIIKGILDVEDAKLAAKTGAAAIVVSNHGGRQLDGAPSSISMLPKISDAVGGDVEVLFDGGLRTGADMMRALALGARACMIGRAYVYGLGAEGEKGVARSIEILHKELDVTMALAGVRSVSEIGPGVLAE